MGHIHAQLMAQYAEDAMETDAPWERWEFSHDDRDFLSLDCHPLWIIDNKYRRKQIANKHKGTPICERV